MCRWNGVRHTVALYAKRGSPCSGKQGVSLYVQRLSSERLTALTDDEATADGVAVFNLQTLIRARIDERGWSYSDLERLAGGRLTKGRWHQLATGIRMERFPEPDTINLLAEVLAVDATAVVLATAATLGIPVRPRGPALAQLLPSGTDNLSDQMRDAVLAIIRAAVAESLTSNNDNEVSARDAEAFAWPKTDSSRGRNAAPRGGENRT